MGRTETFKHLTCPRVMHQPGRQAGYIRREHEVQAGRFVTSVRGIDKDHLWLLYLLRFASKYLMLRSWQWCREELRDSFNSAKPSKERLPPSHLCESRGRDGRLRAVSVGSDSGERRALSSASKRPDEIRCLEGEAGQIQIRNQVQCLK